MMLDRATTLLTRRITPGNVAAAACVAVIGLVIASALDQWAYEQIVSEEARRDDWYRALRGTGYLPTWITMAIVFLLIDMTTPAGRAPNPRWWRAALMAAGPTACGFAAEMLKLVVRRERPNLTDGLYAFRPIWESPFISQGFGMPSSHVAVSFGAAFVLSYLFPAASPVFILSALGCAMTRLFDHSHFLSDSYVALVLSFVIVLVLIRGGLRPSEPQTPSNRSHTS